MKTATIVRSAMVLAVCLAVGIVAGAGAAEPAAAPTTFWSFFGIPDGIKRVRDATVNRRGNHPNLERKPPVKRLADPELLKSEVDAIKVAAEIKKQQDEAPQTIKAIKFLGDVGCGCYPGVAEALAKSLNDCTEEVRYEAAIALCKASGSPCNACSQTCCSAEVIAKLKDVAYGQDENGCPKEASSRVRAAARNALNACQRRMPSERPIETPPDRPIETPPGRDVETPQEAPRLESVPDAPTPAPRAPGGLDAYGPAPMPGNQVSTRPGSIDRAIDLVKFSEDDGEDTVFIEEPEAGYGDLCGAGCGATCGGGCPDCGASGYGGSGYGGTGSGPSGMGDGSAGGGYSPLSNTFASSLGAASGPQSAAPNMIGDLFGSQATPSTIIRSYTFGGLDATTLGAGPRFQTIDTDNIPITEHDFNNGVSNGQNGIEYPVADIAQVNDATGRFGVPLDSVPAGGSLVGGQTTFDTGTDLYTSQFDLAYAVDVPSPGAAVVGRLKIAENTSPMPRDRLFLNYSMFDGVPLSPGGISVHRITPGFEKTFHDGMSSFEMKVPMAVTLDSVTALDGPTDASSREFGNLALTLKRLVLLRRNLAVSVGMTLAVPTADDLNVTLADGTPLVQIENEAVHLEPFFGVLWTPNDRFFAHGFMQWDVAANSNPVAMANQQYPQVSSAFTHVGDIHDTTFQYVDVGIGQWLYRGCGTLTGLAWTTELHWNRSLEGADYVVSDNLQVGESIETFELFNVTVGAHLEFCRNTTVTVGFTTPLGGGRDRQFDGEFRLLVNRRFGASTRAGRTPWMN